LPASSVDSAQKEPPLVTVHCALLSSVQEDTDVVVGGGAVVGAGVVVAGGAVVVISAAPAQLSAQQLVQVAGPIAAIDSVQQAAQS
jgi:hypothetical protein